MPKNIQPNRAIQVKKSIWTGFRSEFFEQVHLQVGDWQALDGSKSENDVAQGVDHGNPEYGPEKGEIQLKIVDKDDYLVIGSGLLVFSEPRIGHYPSHKGRKVAEHDEDVVDDGGVVLGEAQALVEVEGQDCWRKH